MEKKSTGNEKAWWIAFLAVAIIAILAIYYFTPKKDSIAPKTPAKQHSAEKKAPAKTCPELLADICEKGWEKTGECFAGDVASLKLVQKGQLATLEKAGCIEPSCETLIEGCEKLALFNGECFAGEADTPEKKELIAQLTSANCIEEVPGAPEPEIPAE